MKKEEIVQAIKKMLHKFDQCKKKIDEENENDDPSFWVLEENRTQRQDGEVDELNDVLLKLRKVFRWIEKYLSKIESFTQSKGKFIEVRNFRI